ncbi:hypothetical protein SAMN05421733_104196 [Acinetobacter boissieri]|uniref:Uncharacterized protein n=1 Tax=Acinetobacter boissieri TaxID=1219383 RepID=A0A1G6HAB9_9GAMM|nr:hypothetical protein SAMN05421733_104196 [Acinetobacter boissieri]
MKKIFFALILILRSSLCFATEISFSGLLVEDTCNRSTTEYKVCSTNKISNFSQQAMQYAIDHHILTLTYF